MQTLLVNTIWVQFSVAETFQRALGLRGLLDLNGTELCLVSLKLPVMTQLFLVKIATVKKVYDLQLCFISRHHCLLLHRPKVLFLVMNSLYTVQFRIA